MALVEALTPEQQACLAILILATGWLFLVDPALVWLAAKRRARRSALLPPDLLAHRASMDLPDHSRGSGARMSALFDDEQRLGSQIRESEGIVIERCTFEEDPRWRKQGDSLPKPYRGGDAA